MDTSQLSGPVETHCTSQALLTALAPCRLRASWAPYRPWLSTQHIAGGGTPKPAQEGWSVTHPSPAHNSRPTTLLLSIAPASMGAPHHCICFCPKAKARRRHCAPGWARSTPARSPLAAACLAAAPARDPASPKCLWQRSTAASRGNWDTVDKGINPPLPPLSACCCRRAALS
jgi:hypothetical protein